jgi:hypothetical protein
MTTERYCFEARNLLRAQMASKGVTVTELSRLLSADGVHEDPRPLSAKINRGKFSFSFFLHCMKVLGIGLGSGVVLLPHSSGQRSSPIEGPSVDSATEPSDAVAGHAQSSKPVKTAGIHRREKAPLTDGR